MNEKATYIVIVDDHQHCFFTHDDFCNFMSENSDRLIERIEKNED